MAAPVLMLTTATPSSSTPQIVEPQSQQQQQPPTQTDFALALNTLSRNASVISTSSSSSSSSSIVVPIRPRPIRTFSNHSNSTARARSPTSPTTPTRTSIPAAFLPRSLSPESRLVSSPPTPASSRPGSRHASRPPNNRSRSNSSVQRVNGAPLPISADDFEFGDILGSGSYSSVMQATHRTTGNTYAMKIIDKAHIIRHRKVKYATIEKTCLARLGTGNIKGAPGPKSPERNHSRKPSGLSPSAVGHPGIIKMHWAFHDETSLYFVLDLAPNGELLTCIRRQGSLSYPLAKYYTAQLVDTLAYMHDLQVLHRDVKPENVLLDAERRIKLTDFGSAKLMDEDKGPPSGTDVDQRSSSFVGSALYVSPELLINSTCGKCSDVWALGSIIYYMIAGDAPFKSMSEYLTFEKIKQCSYQFPLDDSPEAFQPDAKDLVQKILVLDTNERYTLEQIRGHPFLSSINWATLWTEAAPPLEPGARRNAAPPPSRAGMFDEDADIENVWDQFIPRMPESEDESEEDEISEEELERIRRRYGKKRAAAAPESVPEKPAPLVVLPVVNEPEAESSSKPHHHQTPSPPGRALSSVSEEPPTPKSDVAAAVTTPKPANTGFVVVSRDKTKEDKPAPPPPIDSAPAPIAVPSGPKSASSVTSSEGSPVDLGIHHAASAQSHGRSSNPLGVFTRVWGKGARRGSTSSVSGSGSGVGALTSGLGLSVWSNTVGRRSSFGSASVGKKLEARAGSNGSSSRRMSTNGGGSTRSSSHSRKGSRSGSSAAFGTARADMGKWSSIFHPGEQVLYHSPIYSRTRRGLLPSKRRVLVLTDYPRLLCVKEYPDRAPAVTSNNPALAASSSSTAIPTHAGDVIIKSEILFSPTSNTGRPQVLSKISEQSGEGASAVEDADSSTEEAATAPSTSKRRQPSFSLGGSRPQGINLIKSAEAKGDKMFVVRTTIKNYTYIADDTASAAQWLREIEEVRSAMQADSLAPS